MRKNYFICKLVVVLGMFLCAGSAPSFAAEEKFVPPEGRILFFAGQNDACSDDYVKTTGIVPAGFMLYTSVQMANGLSELCNDGAGESCGQHIIDTYPGTALQIGLYMVDALDDVARGAYDSNLEAIGKWIQASGRPVFLRIGYEFDGPHNHYEPKKYIKAYRYIVKYFRKKKIDNVAYVWHSYAASTRTPLMDWYPGDEYVDWFGISFFAQHESNMRPMLKLSKEHGKPVMVAEAAPMNSSISTGRGMHTWRQWFQRYFRFIEQNGIQAFCYINCDWDALPMFAGNNYGDSRLSTSEEIRRMWTDELQKDKYLRASPGLFELIGFKGDK